LAFGIYALSQCIFQIPLGWASDRCRPRVHR
jgi:hypothetical protein